MTITQTLVAAVVGGLFLMSQPQAAPQREQGDVWLRGGGTQVFPKSDNNAVVNVDDELGFGFNVSYMILDDWAIEVLAAMPFEHEIRTLGKSPVGSVQHLPPTVSIQYHPDLNGPFSPTSARD